MSEYYEDLLEREEGCCAICSSTIEEDDTRLVVDYDYEMNLPKGILCNNCSIGITHMKGKPELLRRAYEYCEYWQEENLLHLQE
jgi:hypothetical protein